MQKIFGALLFLLIFSSCLFDSKSKEIFARLGPEKILRFFVPLKDGLPNGVVKSYTTHGEVFSEQNYVNGIKEGAGNFKAENKTLGESVEYNYHAGLLDGPIIHKIGGKEVSRELYAHGLPADWKEQYKSPFSAPLPGPAVELRTVLKEAKKIYCGWIEYADEQVRSDNLELSLEGDQIRVARLYSEAFTFEPNVFQMKSDSPADADHYFNAAFVKGIYSDREGEMKFRLYTANQKMHLQGYGYLKKKVVPITEQVLKQDDSVLVNLFSLKYDNDLVDRSGFQKIDLNCNTTEIEDRTDYTHDDEEE